jgi:hypothetical protein
LTKSDEQINKEMRQYLLEILNYLDGRGIVFEDEEAVMNELKTLNFGKVREIINGK